MRIDRTALVVKAITVDNTPTIGSISNAELMGIFAWVSSK